MSRARSRLKRLLIQPDTPETADKVSQLVAETDCEEEGTEWRSGIDVSNALNRAVETNSIRSHMVEEHAAYHSRAAVRAYAEHSRFLRTCPCEDLPGWRGTLQDAGWQSHERWLKNRRTEGSPSTYARRFTGHDTLSTDEALLVANALADPMCPFFLLALAMTSRDIYAASTSLLAGLRTQHQEVLGLCDPLCSDIRRLAQARVIPELAIVSGDDYRLSGWYYHGYRATELTHGQLRGSCPRGLRLALRALVACGRWWSTLTTLNLVFFPYRCDLKTTAAFLLDVAAAIVPATSLRTVLLAPEVCTTAVADRATSSSDEAAAAANDAARACEALEAAEPEQPGAEAHRAWLVQMQTARAKRDATKRTAETAAAKAALEQVVVRAEEAVVQACRDCRALGRQMTWSRLNLKEAAEQLGMRWSEESWQDEL
jgi:hypothetical protein